MLKCNQCETANTMPNASNTNFTPYLGCKRRETKAWKSTYLLSNQMYDSINSSHVIKYTPMVDN